MIKNLELTLDLYEIIIPRIIDISLGGENWYSIDQDTSLSDYERFILNENLGKPSLKRVEREFNEHKQELLNELYSEMQEIYNSMKYPKIGLIYLEIDKKPKDYLREIKESENIALLNNWKDAYELGMQEREKKEEVGRKKNIGQRIRLMCDSTMNVIIGYNVTRSLTTSQQNQMKSKFKDIFGALQSYQPALAKSLIQDVEIDDILVTEEMKQDVLKEL